MVTGRLQLKQKYDGSQVAMLIYVQNSGNKFINFFKIYLFQPGTNEFRNRRIFAQNFRILRPNPHPAGEH
jgi:hypothetical protein